jgi:hypothetical protein
VAKCCGDPSCDHWVTIPHGPHWKPPCAGAAACVEGAPGLCCYLKDSESKLGPAPAGRVGQLAGTVTPSTVPPPVPGTIGVQAAGFTVAETGERIVLLVNTDNRTVSVTVTGAGGAACAFIDEAHGHGDVLPGRSQLSQAGTVTLGGFAVSLVRLSK